MHRIAEVKVVGAWQAALRQQLEGPGRAWVGHGAVALGQLCGCETSREASCGLHLQASSKVVLCRRESQQLGWPGPDRAGWPVLSCSAAHGQTPKPCVLTLPSRPALGSAAPPPPRPRRSGG